MTSEIEKLTMELIGKALKSTDRNYVIDRDGDYRLTFKKETALGEMVSFFKVNTEGGYTLKCTGYFDIEIPQAHLSTAVYLCNEYHNSYLLPCAFVIRMDDSTGKFCLRYTVDLEKGIHLEGLTNFFSAFIAGCSTFETWICEQSEFWL